MRKLGVWVLAGIGLIFITGCGSHPAHPMSAERPAPVPLDARLAQFASLHSERNLNGLRPFFATNAILHSPLLPRGGSPDDYLRALLVEPFSMRVQDTRVLMASSSSARTRSRVQMFSPARFSLDERMDVEWVFEDGDWRIARLDFPDWPMIVGVWKKAGLRGEYSMELRILPGGNYLVYADKDRSVPSFRGSWTWEQGALTLTETSSSERSLRNSSPGTYAVVVTRSTAEFRLLSDEHRWRSARFPGIWTSSSR